MPTVGAEFVAHMEDILDLYAMAYDPRFPTVTFDETPYQLVRETRPPVHTRHALFYDYEYERAGSCNLFMFFEPLAGWRHVKVTDQRTKIDFAQCMKDLVDVHYPAAERIRLVCDQLNTHKVASLYEAFAPEEARRIARKIEWHYTPKHASWLNMAEIEISVMHEQCTGRRIGERDELITELAAWEQASNENKRKVTWSFTTASARERLKRLYPSITE